MEVPQNGWVIMEHPIWNGWFLGTPSGNSQMEVPQNCWFRMENPIKMDDVGIPTF